MKYINENMLKENAVDWEANIRAIEIATSLLKESQCSQPLKPYLRFKDFKNRIIAMPAYVGGDIDSAGIKWIASFPNNIKKGIKRAHATIILNNSNTGVPVCVFNTAYISILRTASVSGFFLKKYFNNISNPDQKKNYGIIGFGPIGQMHLDMLVDYFGENMGDVYIYDINEIDSKLLNKYQGRVNVNIVDSWEQVYDESEIFITATVSSSRYINKTPKAGGIYLNVSLRDFVPSFLEQTDVIVVDEWSEVCREQTDIEEAHNNFGLSPENVLEITDLLTEKTVLWDDKSIIFNPMGMAVYDIAIADYYYKLSEKLNFGITLED